MKRKSLLYGSALAVAGFISSAAFANDCNIGGTDASSKNEVLGTVYQSENRKPLRDVVVTAYSNTHKKETRAITDQQGNYSFNDLKPGVYRISFERDGYRRVSRDKVLVKTDDGFHLDIGMEEVHDFEWVPGAFNFSGGE